MRITAAGAPADHHPHRLGAPAAPASGPCLSSAAGTPGQRPERSRVARPRPRRRPGGRCPRGHDLPHLVGRSLPGTRLSAVTRPGCPRTGAAAAWPVRPWAGPAERPPASTRNPSGPLQPLTTACPGRSSSDAEHRLTLRFVPRLLRARSQTGLPRRASRRRNGVDARGPPLAHDRLGPSDPRRGNRCLRCR